MGIARCGRPGRVELLTGIERASSWPPAPAAAPVPAAPPAAPLAAPTAAPTAVPTAALPRAFWLVACCGKPYPICCSARIRGIEDWKEQGPALGRAEAARRLEEAHKLLDEIEHMLADMRGR